MAGIPVPEIKTRLTSIPGWEYSDGKLCREFQFDRFMDGIEFVHRVAEIAEEIDHHPDIDIRYTTVRVAASSHDVGGITERDFTLAARIDGEC